MRKPDRLKSGVILRCAIYTRKSSEEGLEQEFNSLDAQQRLKSTHAADLETARPPDATAEAYHHLSAHIGNRIRRLK
jgi:hypothetical protein